MEKLLEEPYKGAFPGGVSREASDGTAGRTSVRGTHEAISGGILEEIPLNTLTRILEALPRHSPGG